jgi:hypothetical protein
MGGGSDLGALSGAENCMLGITAGIGTKMTNYPLLSWKNTVQQGLPISFNPKIVYRGVVMACLNLGGTTGVQFGTTGYFQKLLKGAGADATQTQMGGAFLGGLASGVPCSLWELTMIQQQRHGTTLLGTLPGVASKYGSMQIFRGLSMTLGRESLFTLAMLGITPKIQSVLVEDSGMESNTALAAGSEPDSPPMPKTFRDNVIPQLALCSGEQAAQHGTRLLCCLATIQTLCIEAQVLIGIFFFFFWQVHSVVPSSRPPSRIPWTQSRRACKGTWAGRSTPR